jgi:hypothetical protein
VARHDTRQMSPLSFYEGPRLSLSALLKGQAS